MKRFIRSLFALAMWAGLTASSQAHVQVTPLTAAPGDAVRFEFLVPNERDDVSTVAVSLQIPKDVDPFSFDDPPGWRRTLNKAGDGRIDVVRWRGRLRSDGFTEFAFLASTPQREGPITWRSTQTYADGKETAWVGPPESDEPAAVTQVDADAPRRDAGGEGEGGVGAEVATDAPATPSTSGDDDNRDPLAIALGAGGLALGAVALFVALRRRGAG
jgi:uncharacterized protein YcnI